jgi:hypothetical protein
MPSIYEKFSALQGLELGNYSPPPGSLSAAEIQSFVSNLWQMDGDHLACAVVILGHYCPDQLLPEMSTLLNDPRPSVWSAAERVLLTPMPKELVPAGMLNRFLRIIENRGNPQASWVIERLKTKYQS